MITTYGIVLPEVGKLIYPKKKILLFGEQWELSFVVINEMKRMNVFAGEKYFDPLYPKCEMYLVPLYPEKFGQQEVDKVIAKLKELGLTKFIIEKTTREVIE